jgi:uncharacterized protein (DUF58 family)
MYLASSLLAVALLTAVVLLMLLVLTPPREMTVAVGGQQPTECPAGSGAPACFQFDVTNTSERDGVAGCLVTPAAKTEASFLNGSRIQEVPLSAGEVQEVYVKVTPAEGGDTVFAPLLVCQPG